MKKIMIATLALVMCFSSVFSTAQAIEPLAQAKTVTEGNRGRSYRGGRSRGRGDWGRRGYRRSHGSFGGALLGGAISGLVIGGIVAANQPKYYSAPAPTMVCDAYGNCWYQ